MNFNFFISVIGISLLLAFRGFFAYAIYLYCKPREQLNSDLLIKLSFFFPFATGLFCLFKGGTAEENREHRQSIAAFFASLIFLVASFASGFYLYNNWYNIMGRVYAENAKVKYYDRDNNTYSYRFEKNGYDYLFINDTDERLVTDLCYLDADGYLYYDKEMNIVADGETRCVDKNGNTYYPVRYVKIDRKKNMSYSCKSFYYDREGNAYTYDYVPYYDREGNKYSYSFNSNTLKGTYTNVATGEGFDNEHSFVDADGYFVYDDNNEFVRQEDGEYHFQYIGGDGQIYYWASDMHWDENAYLCDSNNKIVK